MKKEIKKKKILVWADSPSVPTGWGHVVKFVLSKMNKKKYEFVILGINYYGDPHTTPYRIYPPGTKTPGDVYGMTRLADIIHIEKPDILWLINDIWVIKDMLEAIKQTYTNKTPPIVVYFPVDAEDHSPSWYKNLDMVAKAVVYNDFGLSVAKKASTKTEFSIIGHGVDSRIFHPVFENRVEARKFLFGNVPALWDCFTFLNANRNQGRKRLDITMRAFKMFAEDKPDVRLYLHCGIIDAGIDVLRLAENLGIDNKLIVSSKTTGVQRVSDERLNLIYNASDVGINSGLGEGFSLCQAEHASTGAPQIVPNHSALTDLYKDCGLLVPADIKFVQDKISTTGRLIRDEDLAEKMQEIYSNKELYSTLSVKSISKFTSKEFTWEYIAKQWDELFSEL